MNLERPDDLPFENYNEAEVQDLLGQGWQMDADGISEDEAVQMTGMINGEHKLLRKEDGTCAILVKQENAYESMGGADLDQMRSGVRGSVDEVMGESGSNNRP